MKGPDLVTRIKWLNQATEGLAPSDGNNWPITRLIRAYLHSSRGTPLFNRVWCDLATFREKYEEMGEDFLSDENMGSIMGANHIEESIGLLDEAFFIAARVDAAQYLLKDDLTEYEKMLHLDYRRIVRKPEGIWDLDDYLVERLKKLGFVEGPKETAVIKKKHSWTKTAPHRCIDAAVKIAKKKNYDMFTSLNVEERGRKLIWTFAFYKVKDCIYAWA